MTASLEWQSRTAGSAEPRTSCASSRVLRTSKNKCSCSGAAGHEECETCGAAKQKGQAHASDDHARVSEVNFSKKLGHDFGSVPVYSTRKALESERSADLSSPAERTDQQLPGAEHSPAQAQSKA